VGWDPAARSQLLTEADQRFAIMPAAEVQWLVDDLCQELTPAVDGAEAQARTERFRAVLAGFVQDWRQLCALHGVSGRARPDFVRLAGAVHQAVRPLAAGLVMRTNGAGALLVLEKRVLQHLVAEQGVG
jgi:hypothetical protein